MSIASVTLMYRVPLINIPYAQKMTMVNRYPKSVNVNSFVPFSLVGRPRPYWNTKTSCRRLLGPYASQHSRSPTLTPLPLLSPRAPYNQLKYDLYRENDHFHETTGYHSAHENIFEYCALNILISYIFFHVQQMCRYIIHTRMCM